MSTIKARKIILLAAVWLIMAEAQALSDTVGFVNYGI